MLWAREEKEREKASRGRHFVRRSAGRSGGGTLERRKGSDVMPLGRRNAPARLFGDEERRRLLRSWSADHDWQTRARPNGNR